MAYDPDSRPVVHRVEAGPNAKIIIAKETGDIHFVPDSSQTSPRHPKPTPIKWRYLSSIGTAVVVAVALFFWAHSTRRQSVQINSPRPGSRINDLTYLVQGRSSNISSAEEIWPVLFSRDDLRYYLHVNHTKLAADGRWCSEHVLLPADRAPNSDNFDVVVLMIKPDAAKMLADELSNNPTLTTIEKLPAGATAGDRIGLSILRPPVGSETENPGCDAILAKNPDHESALAGSALNKDLLHVDSGVEVDAEINAELSSARLRQGYSRWVVVRSGADDIYFPQPCVVQRPGPGNSSCRLEIGAVSDFGVAFKLLLVEANEDANRSLDRYIAQKERRGLSELPAGGDVVYSLDVVRKGRKGSKP